ncbi:MAG: serine kinase [Pseudomonadota bacterium]
MAPDPDSESSDLLHACAAAIADRGLLITGAAGTGKSTLLCELLALGADLVADDRVVLSAQSGCAPTLSAPRATAGLVEMRGAGILRMPHRDAVPLWLIADLDATPAERMPPALTRPLCGHSCPVMLCRSVRGAAARLILVLRSGRLPDPFQGAET